MSQYTISTTGEKFQADVLKSSSPVLVDFWAEWCGPCKAIAPKLEAIAQELGNKVKIVKVDVDANQAIAAQFSIRSIPTMILFKDGKPVGQIQGNQPRENIESFLAQHL